jgi:hypothetical protein
MAWTTFRETLLLSSSWQLIDVSDAELYRFSVVSGNLGTTGVSRYEVGQFDTDGSGYGLRTFRTEPCGLIVPYKKPYFFETQRLGFRVPTGFNPFTLKIEVNDMPFTNLGSANSSTTAQTLNVAASTTEIVIASANPDRKMLSITNLSSKSLYIDFDGAVTATAYAVEVKANVMYEMPVGFSGEVRGIWATGATGSCKTVEFF